jgi:hypothetical protein
MEATRLRPIERRILELVQEGMPHDEIARRFRRSTDYVERVIMLASLPGRRARDDGGEHRLRPLERCILGWRARGASHAEIAPRFRRGENFVAQVETLAQYKLATR